MKKSENGLIKTYRDKLSRLKKALEAINKQEGIITEESIPHAGVRKEAKPQEMRVSLSIESVVKATFAIAGIMGLIYLLGYLKDVIILFLVALFLAAAFGPAVDRLERMHLPRWLAILVTYVLVLGLFVIVFTSLVPVIADQIGTLAGSFKDILQNLLNPQNTESWIVGKLQGLANQVWKNVDQAQLVGGVSEALRNVAANLGTFAGNAIGAIFTLFNGLFNLVLVLIISFFMIIDKKLTGDFFRSLFPHKYSAYIEATGKEISVRIGNWIRGQFFLAFAMGILTFIAFTVIGINYALTLAMVSAIGEFIPYLGPLITFVSALLIAANQDPALVLWLLPAYAVVQFIESNIMVPLIVGKTVGLNPIVVLFALLCGAALGTQLGGSYALGLLGMILAVPVANILSIFVEEYTEKNK